MFQAIGAEPVARAAAVMRPVTAATGRRREARATEHNIRNSNSPKTESYEKSCKKFRILHPIQHLSVNQRHTMNLFTSLWLCVLTALCLFLPQAAYSAQTADPGHKLLWKISGNDLPAPSYLYGTMHVQDERAFRFSDSVLTALRACDAFAMEVLPDSAITYMLRSLFLADSTDSIDVFRKYMTDEQYDKLNGKLQESFGVNPSNISKSKPWLLKYYLNNRNSGLKKDRATFVDGYLYRIARQFRKEIFGLEEIEKQLRYMASEPIEEQVRDIEDAIENSEEKTNDNSARIFSDSLISLYYQGRIDGLLALVSEEGEFSTGFMQGLITRNHMMVETLLPRIQHSSVFVAVGAAHLPGPEGLIDLLQKRGYTVVPVTATFTGLAGSVTEQPLNEPWHTITSDEAYYTVEMPIVPISVPLQENGLDYTMKLTTDLGTGTAYFATHFSISMQLPDTMMDAMLDSTAQAMAIRGTRQGEIERITVQGVRGLQFAMQIDNGYLYTVQLFMRRDILYMFMVGTSTPDVRSYDMDRFFSSIIFKDLPVYTALSRNLVDTTGAFAISFPSEPSLMKQGHRSESETDVTTYLYSSLDPKDGTTYLAGYYQYAPGKQAPHQIIFFANALQNMASSIGAEIVSHVDTTYQNFPTTEGLLESPKYTVRLRLLLRENRPYITMVISEKGQLDQQEAERFLNSLQLLDFRPTAWQPYSSEEHGFTVQLPGVPNISRDTSTSIEITYAALDTNSGANYSVVVHECSEYLEAKDEDDFFEIYKGWYTGYLDSVHSTRRYTIAGYPAIELIKGNLNESRLYKICGVLCGRRVYTLTTYRSSTGLATPESEKFFSSFGLQPGITRGTIFEDRTTLLFRDISSTDSTVHKSARAALRLHAFTSSDLPLLYRALEHAYSDDSEYSGVRSRLIDKIEEIADSTTPVAIRSVFPLMSTAPQVQRDALSLLASIGTEQSLSIFTELVTGSALSSDAGIPFYAISATTANCRVMFPGILPMIDKDASRSSLYYFICEALDSSIITRRDLESAHDIIFRMCEKDYDRLKAPWEKGEYDYYFRVEYTAHLLGYIGSDRAKTWLHRMAADTSLSLVTEAALALARNNDDLLPEQWERIADNPFYRCSLYQGLEKISRTALFPQKYYNQESLAEADMVAAIIDYDEPEPEKIELVQEYEITEGDKAGRYFLFKYLQTSATEEGETTETWYVGISGPQPLDSTRVVARGTATAILYNELDAMNMDEHIAAFMNNN